MEDVDLEVPDTSAGDGTVVITNPIPSLCGIGSKLLSTALENRDDFHRLYETFTDKTLRHFTVANFYKNVQSSMTDLAILKYHLKDYAAAASYLYRTTRVFGEDGWAEVELSMLVLYADCLKQLQRKEEYVRVVLKLLEKSAVVENEKFKHKTALRLGSMDSLKNEPSISTEPYLGELLQITKTLQNEVQVPLQNFVGQIEVDSTPKYHPEKDSYALRIRLRYLLPEDLTVEKASVKIGHFGGDSHRDLWLESEGSVKLKQGMATIVVQSNVSHSKFS
jgi:hypothetical protein